jgi:hypothetical protein
MTGAQLSISVGSAILLLRIYPQENNWTNIKRCMYKYIYHSSVCNSEKLAAV